MRLTFNIFLAFHKVEALLNENSYIEIYKESALLAYCIYALEYLTLVNTLFLFKDIFCRNTARTYKNSTNKADFYFFSSITYKRYGAE